MKVKKFSALHAEGSLTTAFGSRRTTTKLFPTALHVMYTPSIVLDPPLRGAMCGHGSIVRGIASTYCSGPRQSRRPLFSPSSTQTWTRITSLLRFLFTVSLVLLNEGLLQEIKIITLPNAIYNRTQNLRYIYKWSTFWGNKPPQLRISLRACCTTYCLYVQDCVTFSWLKIFYLSTWVMFWKILMRFPALLCICQSVSQSSNSLKLCWSDL